MKIVLVGAGSVQFGYGTLSDIFCSKTLMNSEIVLHDINAKTLDVVYNNAQKFIEAKSLPYTVSATTDRKAAFQNADFIISSIEVGDRFKLWDEDWKVPQQYGIHQVYGENGGPGGTFHALRIIPSILDIVKDAQDICPDAYIFNYSNPMTAICTTVKRAFPNARFIGMCHEIAWLNRWLPPMLNKDEDDLFYRAAGLNHFSCMLNLKDKKTGKDLYPEVLAKAHDFFKNEPGYSDFLDIYFEKGLISQTEKYSSRGNKIKGNYEWADRTLLKFILETYNLLPITVDSHFGEYIGWAWDVADHKGIMDFYNLYKIMLGHKEPELNLTLSERVIPIIDGILSNENYEEAAVNVLNDNLIPDLPSWIAVEVPALINKDGVHGIKIDAIPKGFLALLRNYTGVYDLIAEAIIHKKKDYVIEALLASPVVHTAKNVAPMVEHMISRQKPWLDYLK